MTFETLCFEGLLFCALANAVLVVLTCNLIMQATTQVKILNHTLKHVLNYTEAQQIHNKITECVKHYANIIRYLFSQKK